MTRLRLLGLYKVLECVRGDIEMRNRVKRGEQSFLLKLFFHTQQCHGKTSKQESQSISFIKEYKNRRRKPNKSQTA